MNETLNTQIDDNDTDQVEDQDSPMPTKELLYELLYAIVEEPLALRVVEINDAAVPGRVTYHVEAGPKDRGKIIGKNGSVAHLIRSLIRLIGQRSGIDHNMIELCIDGGPDHKPKQHNDRPYNNQGFQPGYNQNYGNNYGNNEQMVLVPVSMVQNQRFGQTRQRRPYNPNFKKSGY